MALKDRFRRITRSTNTTRSNSSTSSTTTPAAEPSAPSITLTKTSSRLSKKLTWRTDKSADKKKQKREEDWEEWDRKTPIPAHKSGRHQEMLRAFEWKWRSSLDGGARRSSSLFSGVSPGQSRVGSVDDGAGAVGRSSLGGRGSLGPRRRSSASGGPVGLERVRSGDAVETVIEE